MTFFVNFTLWFVRGTLYECKKRDTIDPLMLNSFFHFPLNKVGTNMSTIGIPNVRIASWHFDIGTNEYKLNINLS